MNTLQDVPYKLRPQVEAAVSWINQSQNRTFELTGLVDYEPAMDAAVDEGYELGLVLCDGEICTREQVRVEPSQDGWDYSLVATVERDIPPLLDPPEGLRRS